jgi:hypothetical protein
LALEPHFKIYKCNLLGFRATFQDLQITTLGFRATRNLALEPQNYNFQKIYSLLSFSIFSLIFLLISGKKRKKIPKKRNFVTSLAFFET